MHPDAFVAAACVVRWITARSCGALHPARMRSLFLALALLSASLPGAAQTADRVRVETFWLEPALPPGALPYRVPAMLHLPWDWVEGDGAVILLSDPAEPIPAPLLRALLAEGALVLELDLAQAVTGPRPAVTADSLQAELDAAIEQLRFETGAGHAAVVGSGRGATTALGALPYGPRYAVAVALTRGDAVVRAQGNAAVRASLVGLCQALAVQGSQPREACREALAGGITHVAR